MKLTDSQRTILQRVNHAGHPVHGGVLALDLDTSTQGAHQSAASLVRKGLLAKRIVRYDGVRGVHYFPTAAGQRACEEAS